MNLLLLKNLNLNNYNVTNNNIYVNGHNKDNIKCIYWRFSFHNE